MRRYITLEQLPFSGIEAVCRDVKIHAGEAEWFVVGAVARDLLLIHATGKGGSRITRDIDLAVALPNWEAYHTLTQRLVASGYHLEREPHRLRSPNQLTVDLIPFGDIAIPDGEIVWPPRNEVRLDVKGFDVLLTSSVRLQVGDALTVQVASIPAQALLKVCAWLDRHAQTSRDAEDLAELLMGYSEIEEDRLYQWHADLFDDPQFDLQKASARMLGREMARLALHIKHQVVYDRLRTFMGDQAKQGEESRLVQSMSRAVRFETSLHLVQSFVQGWFEVQSSHS